MSGLRDGQDAFGQEIYDFYRGIPAQEICERDDGFIDTSSGAAAYFDPIEEWPKHEREAIALAKGRVLDIGCGAGRVGLCLKSRGLQTIGIDISPLAVRTCRLRGLKTTKLMGITGIGPKLGMFDTVVMYCNNFGLMANPKRARWLLGRLRKITNPGAIILASTLDPYKTDDPVNLSYQKWNRERGRMGGQIRLRVRYRDCATPWFDYLMVSKAELKSILNGTGWHLARSFDSTGGRYIGVIEKI